MKHKALSEQLKKYMDAIGLDLSEDVRDQAVDHLLWLLETNQRINLTAVTGVEDGLRLHVVDSLAVLPELLQAPAGPVLDIGTGGGFPGIPLAIASGRPFTLLDSVSKKAAVLREYVDSVDKLGTYAVLGVRSEELARQVPRSFAVVVARAVSGLASLLELSAPLLRIGGHLIAMKGAPSDEEVCSGQRAAELLRFRPVSSRSYTLPEKNEARTVFVFEKTGESTLNLPRREGLAQRKPLA